MYTYNMNVSGKVKNLDPLKYPRYIGDSISTVQSTEKYNPIKTLVMVLSKKTFELVS